MADNLPYEYQSQLEAAARRKQLAEALQKQAFGFQGAQGGGRIAAKTSPLTWLANTATGYLASEGAGMASEKQSQVRQAAEQARRDEMLALLQAPEDTQQELGVRGKFSETRALADTLFKRRQEKLKTFVETTKERDNQTAANTVLSGKLPAGTYTSPALPEPVFGKSDDGSPYVSTTNLKGEKDVKFAPKGVQVINQAPGNEAAMGLQVLDEGLKTRATGAEAAKNVISATSRAVDALERGAFAGGGEGLKQKARMALQAFGVTPAATAETNELKMALETSILSEAAKIKPISNTDIETLRGIVGSIDTDPTALTRALAFGQALAYRGLMDYNDFLGAQGETVQNPIARQRLAGAGIGFELPKQLRGPASFQMEVMRNLQLSGGDISRFNDPTGQPFPKDAKFQVNPTSGFPGVNPKARTTADGFTPPPGWEALTPAQQARYKQLKGIK